VSGMSMPFDVVAWPPGIGLGYQSRFNQGFGPAVYGRSSFGYGGVGSGCFGVACSSLFGPNGPRGVSVSPAPRDITSSIWSKPEEKVKVAGRVIKEYEKALAVPSVAPEAHLRLGYLYYVSRKMDLARSHLAEAARTTTARDHLYLVELFSGWAAEREFRTDAAEAAYRRALVHVPNGRTAVTWLATLLQSRGKVEEAQALVDASLGAAAKIPDPWPIFAQGDFRNWASTMEKLRGELWAGAPRLR
jgi:hypothetical protein